MADEEDEGKEVGELKNRRNIEEDRGEPFLYFTIRTTWYIGG